MQSKPHRRPRDGLLIRTGCIDSRVCTRSNAHSCMFPNPLHLDLNNQHVHQDLVRASLRYLDRDSVGP